MVRVVLDTTIFSNFAHVERPDLLRILFGHLALTAPTVRRELQTGEAGGYIPACDWRWVETAVLTAEEEQLATTHLHILDAGEAECLALTEKRDATLLSDDFAARRLAQQLGIPVSGTLGVLLQLVHNHHITMQEADALLARMIGKGYRSPVTSLTEIHTT